MIEKLKREIKKASEELNSNRLIYFIHFDFGWPAHSLTIQNVDLFREYDMPKGTDGIGEKELIKLEKIGFLKKESEVTSDDLEKTIEYSIVFEEVEATPTVV